MLRLASYDIVFQEIPGEVTLALNLSGCPNRCAGCHSPHLQGEAGEPLDDELLEGLLERYGASATCVCLMGGDSDPAEVSRLAAKVRAYRIRGRDACGPAERGLKTAWYSGRDGLPQDPGSFDYVKVGPYVEALGGLRSPSTNQRLYRLENTGPVDITRLFWL